MKLSDISIPILIIIVILVFILPIPSFVLDILLIVNIMLSAIVLLNTIYLKEALELSLFPSFLVFITLFRLSINVAATRMILAEGKAGEIINGFGKFVARDNPIVGFIIFLIIMLVNFMVITKGSERIAEVAARFTLDAMPGKQMAIDADLNSGLINEDEAKKRRRKIQKEADFYGAMDGASKFIKNDAIVSVIITILNIIGGLVIGMLIRKEDFMQALQNYAVLTIGDGLASQIPALIVSTATSFVVTRAASESDISEDVLKQLFNKSRVMYLAAGMGVLLSLLFATIPFLLISALFVFVGYSISKKENKEIKNEVDVAKETEVAEIRKPESVITLLNVDPIELEFGYSIIPMADVNQGGDLLDRIVMIRRQLAIEMGIIVPIIRLRDNIQLNPNEYVIKIKGVDIARGEIMIDRFLAVNPGTAEEAIEGIKTTEPAFGLPAVWISEDQTDKAEALGYTVVDPPSVIATHLTEVIRKNAYLLIGRQEVQTLLENVKQTHPVLVEELVPKLMTVGEIQKVLVNLLKEGICIRDMITILETLADYAPVTRDIDMLTEYVRQSLGRAISGKYLTGNESKVITLDPELEKLIINSVKKTEIGSYLALEPNMAEKIINNVTKQVQKLVEMGQQPIILASPLVRLYFKRLTESELPDLIVLSYNELDNSVKVQSVGMVAV